MATDHLTVAERIALSLKRHDVTHIFAQSLPSAVILAAEAIGIRQIAYRQETWAGPWPTGMRGCQARSAL